MRFVSKYGMYGVQVVPLVEESYATGGTKIIQEPIYAKFRPGALMPGEYEFALANWSNWNGSLQMADEVTIVSPDYRIGSYDTIEEQRSRGWSDELRLEVERVLILNAEFTDNMLAVPATMVPPPWPRYDDYLGSLEQLLQKLVEEGHNLENVLAYERGTQNRDEIVDALETLVADPEAVLELQPEEVLG
jgi:hypothetical protein